MKSPKINYFVVGLFVIASLVGLVVSIAVLTGRTGATDSYHAVYKNVTGVKFGTQVMYEGYPIGQVEKVTPTPENGGMRFRVDLAVTKGWRIPEDSVATIAAPGLLSAITISIEAGKSAVALKPDSQLKSQESTNIFAVFSSVAGELSALAENNIKPLLINLNKVVQDFGELMDKDGKLVFQDVSALIKESAALVQDLSRRAPIIADNIQDFSERMKQNSDEVSALLTPENRARIERTIGNLDGAAKNLDALLVLTRTMVADNRAHVDKSLSNMRYVVESVARHIDAINQNMEGAARNMYEFSRQIRQNPGLLLGGTPPKDTAPAR
jgi:phospholipid/cholesterol/gamma-HCH transport system substrate-binding protein